jgi:hypothetical protein
MGLRGPLPALRPVASPALSSNSSPDWLGECGQTYWRRHHAYVTEAGLLTEATADSYAVCCALYERLRRMDREPTSRVYLDTLKAWQTLCKLFRLTPTERPAAETIGRYDDAPKFGE